MKQNRKVNPINFLKRDQKESWLDPQNFMGGSKMTFRRIMIEFAKKVKENKDIAQDQGFICHRSFTNLDEENYPWAKEY
jgi:hypothetical protein